MKIILKRIFFTTLTVVACLSWSKAQQYPVFTQYYFNELVINPAYAGNHVQLSLTAMYRNQWVNFPGAPKTFSFSGHTALAKNKVGVGLMVNHDEIGSYKNEHIYTSYSYKIHFPRQRFQWAFRQVSIYWEQIIASWIYRIRVMPLSTTF